AACGRGAPPRGPSPHTGGFSPAGGDGGGRAGPPRAPLDLSVDPSAPLEYAALHPVGRAAPALV
ncbi:hypothetical protein ACFV3O_00485, partial [Streptomyces albidoflavus]